VLKAFCLFATFVVCDAALAFGQMPERALLRGFGGTTFGSESVFGGGFGVNVARGLDIIGEAGRLQTDLPDGVEESLDDFVTQIESVFRTPLTRETSAPTFYALGGVRYQFRVARRVRPFVGSGVGVAKVNVDVSVLSDRDDLSALVRREFGFRDELGLLLSFGGGVNVDVGNSVWLEAEYRYVRIFTDISLDNTGQLVGAMTVGLPLASEQQAERQAARNVSVGIKGGLNVASFRNEDASFDARFGLVAGGFAGYRFSSVVGIQVEGMYSQKGITIADRTIAIDYLEIPALLTLTWRDAERVRAVAFTGPTVERKLSARREDLSEGFQRRFDDFVRDWQFGWAFGGGPEFALARGRLIVEGRYVYGLSPIFNADSDDSDADDKNRLFSVLVGYRF
jgi:opacity protein-like surface antigen